MSGQTQQQDITSLIGAPHLNNAMISGQPQPLEEQAHNQADLKNRRYAQNKRIVSQANSYSSNYIFGTSKDDSESGKSY